MDVTPVFGENAIDGLKKGVDILADAVKVTLGPKGRLVVMRDLYNGIHVTKDGVTVANNISLKDELPNMGVQMVKEVASKTADDVGDGTTTATVLTQAILSKANKYILQGVNPVDLKREILEASKKVIEDLSKHTHVVKNDMDMIRQVASISANNDKFIGDLIGDALSEIGVEGSLSVEESNTSDTYVDILQGMQYDKGFISPYFCTDVDTGQALYDNVMVVVCNDELNDIAQLNKLIGYSTSEKQAVVIISPKVNNEVLSGLVLHKLKGKSNVIAITPPAYGLARKEWMEDIAVLTGTVVIDSERDRRIDEMDLTEFGMADKYVGTAKSTLLINGHGSAASKRTHVEGLKIMRDRAETTFEKDRISERISRLEGGVAVIHVGASSETEMKEKKDRVEDAILATKAAIEEGIIVGGGLALFRASLEEEDTLGGKLLKEALKAPLSQIVTNAGLSPDVIIAQLMTNKNYNYGFDCAKETYGDLIKIGVIDPVKVTRIALENAVSIATMIISTQCALVNNDLVKDEEGLPLFARN